MKHSVGVVYYKSKSLYGLHTVYGVIKLSLLPSPQLFTEDDDAVILITRE